MKFMALGLAMMLTGCAGAPTIYGFNEWKTFPDGSKGFRYIYRGYSPEAISAMVSKDIERTKVCPNGWKFQPVPEEKVLEGMEGTIVHEAKCN